MVFNLTIGKVRGDMRDQFERVQDVIRENDRFLLVTHVNPDGDGIGSQIALHRFLKSLGKESSVVNGQPAPINYHFLDGKGEVQVVDPSLHGDAFYLADVIFILDISNWDRLGRCGPLVRESKALRVCIDHHISNDQFADVNLIDVKASSTGELIYRLITGMAGEITMEIAEPLYVSIITDTGSFRFSNTNSAVHSIAAHLIDIGVDPRGVYENIYENSSIGRIQLLGLALSGLRIAGGGRIAWLKITREMMEKTRTCPQECEGFVDYLRLLKDVEVCLLFIELDDGKVKASLRSRGMVDVNKLAAEYGGGGHRHAAGLFVESGLEPMKDALIRSAERALAR
jgi:phosphoesterase RecJ-like protein